jgi:hypothetical protein
MADQFDNFADDDDDYADQEPGESSGLARFALLFIIAGAAFILYRKVCDSESMVYVGASLVWHAPDT